MNALTTPLCCCVVLDGVVHSASSASAPMTAAARGPPLHHFQLEFMPVVTTSPGQFRFRSSSLQSLVRVRLHVLQVLVDGLQIVVPYASIGTRPLVALFIGGSPPALPDARANYNQLVTTGASFSRPASTGVPVTTGASSPPASTSMPVVCRLMTAAASHTRDGRSTVASMQEHAQRGVEPPARAGIQFEPARGHVKRAGGLNLRPFAFRAMQIVLQGDGRVRTDRSNCLNSLNQPPSGKHYWKMNAKTDPQRRARLHDSLRFKIASAQLGESM